MRGYHTRGQRPGRSLFGLGYYNPDVLALEFSPAASSMVGRAQVFSTLVTLLKPRGAGAPWASDFRNGKPDALG